MIRKEGRSVHFVRNDIILIFCLLLTAVLGLIYLFGLRGQGDTVRVSVDGREYAVYSLSQDITEDIRTGDDGEHINRMVIKDGKVSMEYADCPDGICVAHSEIYRDGESIVCLPHRVVITVVTQGDGDDVDIVI